MNLGDLVIYHGSANRYHGEIMQILGYCGCEDCHPGDVRYALAARNGVTRRVWHVRPGSFTAVTEEEADEQAEAADYFSPDAVRWTPGCPIL
jgi:hypothetical protein